MKKNLKIQYHKNSFTTWLYSNDEPISHIISFSVPYLGTHWAFLQMENTTEGIFCLNYHHALSIAIHLEQLGELETATSPI